MRRLSQIDNLIIDPEIFDDGEDEYDGSEPIEMAKNMSDEQTITFKCECHEEIRVPNSNFPYITCPNCDLRIIEK